MTISISDALKSWVRHGSFRGAGSAEKQRIGRLLRLARPGRPTSGSVAPVKRRSVARVAQGFAASEFRNLKMFAASPTGQRGTLSRPRPVGRDVSAVYRSAADGLTGRRQRSPRSEGTETPGFRGAFGAAAETPSARKEILPRFGRSPAVSRAVSSDRTSFRPTGLTGATVPDGRTVASSALRIIQSSPLAPRRGIEAPRAMQRQGSGRRMDDDGRQLLAGIPDRQPQLSPEQWAGERTQLAGDQSAGDVSQRQQQVRGGTVHLDGSSLGRWTTEYLTKVLTKAPNGMTTLDPRASTARSRLLSF